MGRFIVILTDGTDGGILCHSKKEAQKEISRQLWFLNRSRSEHHDQYWTEKYRQWSAARVQEI